jgi:D-alanyl-D-alanine carboxypeptidase (penicillin-binding protein 5/6)
MFASSFRHLFRLSLCACIVAGPITSAALAKRAAKSAPATEVNPDAYRGAIVIDAATGKVLFEDKADVQNPPASVTKLMTFLVIQDKIQRGELMLQAPVIISAEAAKMGGSEAWLVHKETVSVEQLLYLLMVPSANDAAMALAIHATGSKEAFIDLMNAKARDLGLAHTEFHSPHGLVPGKGQTADLTTARDLAVLSREVIAKTDILRYSSTRAYEFRHGNGVVNRFDNHNHLLGAVPGCDGLKTGWYQKAGYSISVTAQRNGRRVIVVVLGSPERVLRDNVATRLVERGFAALPPLVASAPAGLAPAHAANPTASAPPTPPATGPGTAPPTPTATSAGTAIPPTTAPAEAGTSLKLVPLQPGEETPLGANPATAPAVHVDLSRAKK